MEIGTTRSGTKIEYRPQESIEGYCTFITSLTIEDRFDLYTMLQALAIKALDRYGEDSEDFGWWHDRMTITRNRLTVEEIDQQNLLLGLKTSYDHVRFGTKKLHRFWRELE